MEVTISLSLSIVLALFLSKTMRSEDHYHIELIPVAAGLLLTLWFDLQIVVQRVEPKNGALINETVINATANQFVILLAIITFAFGAVSIWLFKVYMTNLRSVDGSPTSIFLVMLAYITSLIFSLVTLQLNVAFALNSGTILSAAIESKHGAAHRITKAVYNEFDYNILLAILITVFMVSVSARLISLIQSQKCLSQ